MKQSKVFKSAEHSIRKHSTVGASQSERWLNCPGSVAAEALCPPQAESAAANKGTLKHESMERYLNYMKAGKSFKFERGDQELIPVFDYVASRLGELELEAEEALSVEEKVDLSFIDDACFGTNDIAIIQPWGVLEIIDLKTGFKPVSPIDNTQLIYYALGIAHKHDFAFGEVWLTIAQPTVDKVISTWKIPIEKLETYIELFKRGVQRTKDPKAKRFAGKWCKYCRASSTCPALMNETMEKVKVDFSFDEPKNLPALPKKSEAIALANYLEAADKLETWIEAVRKKAEESIKNKVVVPGWQLLPARGKRVWKSEKGAAIVAKKTGVNFYHEPEAMSPAEVEKKIGKQKFEERFSVFTEKKSSGKEVLTRVRDITNDFEEIDN